MVQLFGTIAKKVDMNKYFKDPLIHFVILGILVFFSHSIWQRNITKSDYTINVTEEEMARQAKIFSGENRREPTNDDIKALLYSYIEERALMREAERLGLGEDDTIIRRRLAQKMRFIIEDIDTLRNPGSEELEAWYSNNISRFISPEKRSFTHIYISPEANGGDTTKIASEILTKIISKPENWEKLGDPFILERSFKLSSLNEVNRNFGNRFSKSVFSMPDKEWVGPIESAYGLHIVKVDNIVSEIIPQFKDIENAVLSQWKEEERRRINKDALAKIIDKYKINIINDKTK
ncbi:MAG: peptidylprolyl isomerase [Hellea sp.]|nr:peptidylprolyl isomerase [Hellea sp.]